MQELHIIEDGRCFPLSAAVVAQENTFQPIEPYRGSAVIASGHED
jgi:hypothetical protein